MTQADGCNDRAGADARLIWRAVREPVRPLIVWADIAVLLWLCVGFITAPLPRALRWRVCMLAARFSGWTHRARAARRRVVWMTKIPERDAYRVVRELYAGRFAGYLDVVRGLLFAPDFRIRFSGLSRLEDALAQGRGVVLWISDFVSAGDVSKVALAKAGFPLVHLSRPEHGFTVSAFGMRFLNPLRIRFERAYLAERVVFERMNPAPATARLLDKLRAGSLVSIMATNHEGRALADLPFLKGRITFAVGALRLARKAGAAVVPVFVLRDRDADDVFDIILAPALEIPSGRPEAEALLAAAGAYRDQLEAVVREHPQSWGAWRRADQLSLS
jgi:lauroyl/myristoyl acyltransferase